MENFLLGVYIGLGIVGSAATVFVLIVLVYFLAKNNLFCTFVEEGTAKAVVKFGEFHKGLMAYEGHGFNYDWNVCLITREGYGKVVTHKDKMGSQPEIELRPEPWLRFGGLRWVGIPFIHTVYTYDFEWVSYEQREEGGQLIQEAIFHGEKNMDYIMLKDDVYFSFVRKAETKGMVPLDVDVLLTLRIINPYKALFRIQDWLEAVQNQVKPAVRSFTGGKEYDELTGMREEMDTQFNGLLKSSKIDENIEADYGVLFRKAGFVRFDPSGELSERFTVAATKQWEANREAERVETVYSKIKAQGDTGVFIRTIEGLEEIGKGEGKLVVFPFGSLQSIFEGWLGKKKEGGM